MKTILISILIFFLPLIFVTCEYDSQPTENKSSDEDQVLTKKPVTGELITFTGDLEGNETVVGCCPNAGPNPEYTLTLNNPPFPAEISGTYVNGEIFMNSTGRQSPGDYLVKYWAGSMYLEIRGGEKQYDRRNKILIVTFEQVPCEIWIDDVLTDTVPIDFVITRTRLK